MHATDVEQRTGLSLDAFIERHGTPAMNWHQADRVSEEWHVLTWGCGCIASYLNDTLGNARLDLQVETCARHAGF